MEDRIENILSLIRGAAEGSLQAWESLSREICQAIWSSCRLLTGDDDQARQAYVVVEQALRADNFRRLRAYNGGSRVESFIALVVREVLSEQIVGFFVQGKEAQGWVAFLQFYQKDLDRIIGRRLSGSDQIEARRDAYQDICLALIEGNYRRLKAYQGKGSFSGYVLHVVDRLLIDIIRKTSPRRRNSAGEGGLLRLVSSDCLEQVASPEPSPEHAMLEDEAVLLLDAATKVVRNALINLAVDEQLYMQIALSSDRGMPAREIARLMQYPVTEVYKIRQRVMVRLEKELYRHPDVKNWLASV
jgi:RNA polymerase sigma factor (sigma-70 family)